MLVMRFDFGPSHGWQVGGPAQCRLTPHTRDRWAADWNQFMARSGTRLDDLEFWSEADRAEFLQDIAVTSTSRDVFGGV